MPTYVYECLKCQDNFEVEQKISEEPLKDCKCGATNSLKRIIQPTGIMFKGSGFHINDYSTTASPKSDTPCSDACKCTN